MSLIKREPRKFRSIEPFFSDRFFDAFWPSVSGWAGAEGEAAAPRVDIVEKDNSYLVTADLPGVSKDNIHLSLEHGILTLEAHVEKEDKEEKEGQLIRSERYYGQYLRRLDLGSNASSEGIEASFKNGSLTINIPKLKAKEPETVKIQVK